MELDPLFLKAINLLRSKNPDSAKQLNTLVQEYREKTYGPSVSSKKPADENGNNGNSKNGGSSIKVETIKQAKLSPSPTNIKEKKLSTSPVTLMDKLSEVTNLTDENSSDGFKDEDATIEEITVGSSLEPSSKKQRLSNVKIETFKTSPISDSDANDNIPIDEIIEMDFDGPSCKICHLSKRAEDENLLVECAECHSHFHQQCHKPNVSTKDLNDPRLIWYCKGCMKKMNKEMAAQQQQQQQQQKHSTGGNGKPGNPDAPPKPVSNPFQLQGKQPFRRAIPPTGGDKSSKKPLAAGAEPSASSSSAASTKEVPSREGSPSKMKPRDVAVNAVKRLELVKKRANKMQQLMKQNTRK